MSKNKSDELSHNSLASLLACGRNQRPEERSLGLEPLANTQGVTLPCSFGTLRELTGSLVTKQQFEGKIKLRT